MAQPRTRLFLLFGLAASGLLVLGIAAGYALGARSGTLGGAGGADFGRRVHEYIVTHPEVLIEAADALKAQGPERALAEIADKVVQPYPGAVLGNPNGTLTLVEFSDYACTYCRGSAADVEALVAANPDLKVVLREWPIIAPTSPEAARWGLAAAEQGKYAAFHRAMFAAGRTDAPSIQAAARLAGLDLARARTVAADPKLEAELSANAEFARKLGITGTPSWVVGDQLIVGAVGRAALETALEKAAVTARGK